MPQDEPLFDSAPSLKGLSRAAGLYRLMHYAVIVLVVAVTLNRIYAFRNGPVHLDDLRGLAWHFMLLANCCTFLWLSSRLGREGPQPRYAAILATAVGTLLAMGLLGYLPNQAPFMFLLLVWFVALRFSLKGTLAFVLLFGIVFPSVRYFLPAYSLARMGTDMLFTWGLGGFVAFAAFALRSEMEAEKELMKHHLALLSAQELLRQSGILEERVRISRELHDSIGHHLAALSLQLEAARHQGPGQALASVEKAQQACKVMLKELRDVVGSLRTVHPVDFHHFLQSLAERIEHPRIHVDFSGEIPFEDSARNHALLRALQELVTNTLKHAGARNLWIEVACSPDSAYLVVRDDGSGAPALREGDGLRGLRERVAACAGRVDLKPGPPGFQARVWIPRERQP